MSEAATTQARGRWPWQWPTLAMGLPVSQVLVSGLDADRLSRELAEAGRAFRLTPQDGPHHNGGWNRLGLVSPDGDPMQSYRRPGQVPRKTPVLEAMPYLDAFLDDLGAPVLMASVSVMQPGARVRWHRDLSHSVDLSIVRLHLPVDTTPAATLELAHEFGTWTPGCLWYGDFSFPHRVFNDAPVPRLHIMIDVAAEPARRLFTQEYLAQAPRRRIARALSANTFDALEHLHPAGRYAAAYRAERRKKQQQPVTGKPPAAGTGPEAG